MALTTKPPTRIQHSPAQLLPHEDHQHELIMAFVVTGIAGRPAAFSAARETKRCSISLIRRLCLAGAGAGQEWLFPQRQHTQGETMRQAAERVLQECTQALEPVQTYFLGNGPICHTTGGTSSPDRALPLFFHKAQLIKGSLRPSGAAGASDYAWLSRGEILAQAGELRELLDKVLL